MKLMMGDLLTAVKTVTLRQKPQQDKPLLEAVQPAKPSVRSHHAAISSPEDVLEILRSQPDIDSLEDVLIYLNRRQNQNGFNIKVPSPSSAKIINELVSTTIFDFWESLDGLRDLLIETLRNIASIGAVVARLRLLVSQYKPNKQDVQSSDAARPILVSISVLSQILETDDLSSRVFADLSRLVENQTKRGLLWKEYIASVASGRIVSAVAQAEVVTNTATSISQRSWLSEGPKYSAWLGRNVAQLVQQASSSTDENVFKAAAQLCGKAFSIGYSAQTVEAVHLALSLSDDRPMTLLEGLLNSLNAHEQRQFLFLTLKFISKQSPEVGHPKPDPSEDLLQTPGVVAASACLLESILCNQSMKDHLIGWLSDSAMNSAESFSIRRVALSALAGITTGTNLSVVDDDPMQTVLESNWKAFGDQLFIKHTPIIQQEACVQVLLMSAGYVHRKQSMFLFALARSSLHLNGISNRLNSSSPRARALGMVVGMAISELADKEGSKLTFDVEDMKTPEAHWYQQLIKIDDKVGTVEDMRKVFNLKHSSGLSTKRKAATKRPMKRKVTPVVQTDIKDPRIMEVLDDEEEQEDDDLIPYAKPDSDPEDDDEDPTLVNRNKPKAPVYIRDLIAGLHDTENHDRHTLALKTAASLIRRKSSFGKEVSDHASELALILIGLGNTFDLPDFLDLRFQALIATLLSNPPQLAPWLARQVFDGDYSLSQRLTLLSVLGLSARELAGYKDEDDDLNPDLPSTAFPTKHLPPHLHKLYSGTDATGATTKTNLIASNLSRTFIRPLAAEAADNLSGPNILKVRTFSTRMAVEEARRKKVVPNALANIVAQAFFYPLIGHWWRNTQAYGLHASRNVHAQPTLLGTFIKTLAILLHASGGGTLQLPAMTGEFWAVLLKVRGRATEDVAVMEAVLFGFLTLLEVNAERERGLVEECGRELMETQGWVEMVFETLDGRDEEGGRVRMLAAGVLVKTRELVGRFQRLLVGSMVDY